MKLDEDGYYCVEGAAEPFGAFTVEPAPSYGKTKKQGGKEPGAGQMYVDIGDSYGLGFDGDDHDMGVGFADVVLNNQARCSTNDRPMRAAMSAFDRGAVVPGHNSELCVDVCVDLTDVKWLKKSSETRTYIKNAAHDPVIVCGIRSKLGSLIAARDGRLIYSDCILCYEEGNTRNNDPLQDRREPDIQAE